ncbi:hypothetical protein OROMI_034702 [Orobanche minor]
MVVPCWDVLLNKPKLGLSAKNHGRTVDENVNSQPFMRWRNRFLFCAEAIYKTQAETGEIKGHYLNTTAVQEDSLQILAWLIIAIIMAWPTSSPAMHAVIDRQKNHGIHFRVLAKALRMSGGDHIHLGTAVGKLEGERDITFDFIGFLYQVLFLWLQGVFTFGICLPDREIFGDDSILQFGGGTLGHPWGNAPGAVANRVAIEAYVQARNEGRDLAAEVIIREASKGSPELVAVCEVWKEIKFKFKAVDILDKYCINTSMDNMCPIENNSESEDPNRKNRAKNIHSWVRTHSENRNLTLSENSDDLDGESSALTLSENSDDPCATKNFKHLWVMCENCEKLNYKSLFLSRMNICEHCGYHLKMNSFERIEVLLDPDTWNPMYEDMTSLDPIEWDYEKDLIEWDYEKDLIEWDYEKDLIEWDYEKDLIEWDSEKKFYSKEA